MAPLRNNFQSGRQFLIGLVFIATLCAESLGASLNGGSNFVMGSPEADFSKAELLDEIGMRPDARAFQRASLAQDEGQFIVEPNQALILPSGQHDGIPLAVNEWPVHPENPVDSYEAFRDRLTEAVGNTFPERVSDIQEVERTASAGVYGQTPINSAVADQQRSPGMMSEIEDLLSEVSGHNMVKGAEISVEGGKAVYPTGGQPEIKNPGTWMFGGFMGSLSVFAVPAAILVLYARCKGYNILCCDATSAAMTPMIPASPGRRSTGPNVNEMSGGGLQGDEFAQQAYQGYHDDQTQGSVAADSFFVVHPYGDSQSINATYQAAYGVMSGGGSVTGTRNSSRLESASASVAGYLAVPAHQMQGGPFLMR